MVAIVSGNSLGLELTSLRTLGQQGSVGTAAHGRGGESVYVNAANGNLVLQDRDDLLVTRGPDVEVLRTYNSQGLLDDDNGDNWTDGVAPLPLLLSGTLNAAGSTLTRTDRDGSAAVYAWDSTRALYVTTEGDGAYDTLKYVAADNQVEWTDGPTGATERYAASGPMRMASRRDAAGNAVTFAYDAQGRLATSTAANGDVTWYDRSGGNVTQVRTVTAQGATSIVVRYAYDGSNRLATVSVDLGSGAAYTTSYSYEGTSRRVSMLQQSDGTMLAFSYQLVAGSYRVGRVMDATGGTTTFAYDAATGRMLTAATAGLVTRFTVDAAGRLTGITPPGSGAAALTVAYDAAGNVASVTDGASRATLYAYDNGNRTKERNTATGIAIDRTFDSRNQLLTETTYVSPDVDGFGTFQPSDALTVRHVYGRDGRNLLRFTVSPEGRVTEFRYSGPDDTPTSTLTYSSAYGTVGIPPGGLTLEAMESWAGGQAWAVAQRIDVAFDARGQVQSRTTYSRLDASGTGVADGSQSVEQFVYDQRGRLLQRIAPSGTTTYTHDGLGRELTRRDAAGQLTVTQYQDAVRKTTVTAANGLVTTSTYDAAGRVVATLQTNAASANLGQTTYAYDAAGRMRMSTDPSGVRHWWLWDDAGRCVGEVDGNGTLTESTYDGSGLLLSKTTYATAANTSLLVDSSGNAIAAATVASVRPPISMADVAEWRMYDGAARLVRMARTTSTTTNAVVTGFVYDAASRLVSQTAYASLIPGSAIFAGSIAAPSTSSSDRTTRSFYDMDGRLAGTLDPEGYLVKLSYDPAGRLVERVAYATATNSAMRAFGTLFQLVPAANAADQRTVTFYDASGQVIAQVDAEGYMTEMAYDLDGNLVRSTRYANRVTASFAFSSLPSTFRPAATPADQVTVRAFDALGRLTAETSPDGVVTTSAYDAMGNVVSTTRAAGSDEARTVTVGYDIQGRKTGEVTAELNNVVHAYDLAGRRISTTDSAGHKTLFFYDEDGALRFTVNALGEIRETRYDVLGRVTARIARATRVSIAGLSGGLVTTPIQFYLSPSSAGDSTETFTYTRDGQLASRTDAAGGVTTYTTNTFGDRIASKQSIDGTTNLLTSFSVDRRGLQLSVTQASGSLNLVNSFVYDAFGRQVRATDATGAVTTRSYDRLGRTVTVTDPLNAARTTTYDAFDRVLTQSDALGAVTTYSYDTAARTVRVRTPEGLSTTTRFNRHGQVLTVTDGKQQATSYAYDREGRLVQTTTPLTATGSTYDIAGRLATTTDANGKTVAYTYDAADRVLRRTVDPGGLALDTTWTYDAKGQAVTITDPNNVATTFTYDLAGRVLKQTVDPGGLNLQTVYTYDKRGKTLSVTSPAGTVTQYTYDAAGRRTTEVVDPGALRIARSWIYDGQDRVVAAIDPGGNVTRYVHDIAGQLVFTVDPAGGVQKQVYDAAGRVTQSIAYSSPISPASLPVVATAAQVQAKLAPQASDRMEQSVYDRDGRVLATVDGTGGVVRFTYDPNGNVASRTAYATRLTQLTWQPGTVPLPAADAAHDQVTTYVRDALDRVVFTVDAAGAAVALEYDNNGNVVKRTAFAQPVTVAGAATRASLAEATNAVANAERDVSVRSTYDAANRLTWTADGTGAVVQRIYDRNGNVVRTVAYADTVDEDEAASIVSPNAALDRVTTRLFDKANRLLVEVDPVGAARELTYDKDGHVVLEKSYGTAFTTVPSPTDLNFLTLVRSLGLNDNRVVRHAFDTAGRQVLRIDATGAATETRFDAAGNPVAVVAYANRIPVLTSPLAFTAGQLMTLVVADPATDRATLRAFDAAGRVLYQVGGMGEVEGYQYDGVGRVLRTTRYATPLAAGTTAAQVSGSVTANPVSDRTESFGYDAAGNLLTSTDASGATETFAYDALGGKLAYTDRRGSTWTYAHDAAGRVVQETSPLVDVSRTQLDGAGHVTAGDDVSAVRIVTLYGYDALGNLASRTEAVGLPEQRTTRYEYDAAGRQVGVIHPPVGVYDRAGDADSLATVQGLSARRELADQVLQTQTWYDALGNAVAGRDAGGSVSQKVYDLAGRVLYEIDALGQVTRYIRNAFGEVTSLTRFAAATTLGHAALTAAPQAATKAQVEAVIVAGGADRTILTRYDRCGRVVEVQEPEALTFDPSASFAPATLYEDFAVTWTTYDAFGQAIRVERSRNSADATGAVTFHYFDRSGRESATVDAMGYVTERQFDARGNLTQLKEWARAAAVGSWNVAGYVAPDASVDDRTTVFSYDALDRKIAETRVSVTYSDRSDGSVVSANLVTTYDYDAVGNLTRTTDAAGGATYTTYDRLGRVLAVSSPARAAMVDGVAVASLVPLTTFLRDAHGQVVVQREWAHGALAAGETAITPSGADANDRVTLTTYDAFGRAIATVDAEGKTAYTSYDAWGHVAKTWRGVTDADGVLRTVFQVNVYDAIGQLVQVVEPAPATLGGFGGTVTTALEYDTFGELTRKGTGGLRQEYFDYDNAGRLWRTNTGDGVDRIRLFDALGNVTSEITSSGSGGTDRDLSALTAWQAAVDPTLRRTDTTYDLLGRVTSKLLPARNEAGSGVIVQRGYVEAVIADSVAPIYDEAGNVLGTTGTNSVTLKWAGISSLGPGDLKVELKYFSGPPDGHFAPVLRTWTSGVMDAATTGTTATWPESPFDPNGGISRVVQVTVRKKDINGNWVVVLDQAPGYGSNFIDVAAPADHTTQVVLQLRAAGSAGDSGWWDAPTSVDFGDRFRFDMSGLSVGGYEYRLKLVSQAGEVRSVASGSVAVDKPPLAVIPTPISYWTPVPGALTWAPPGPPVGQVLRYRPSGSTGAWSSLTVKSYGAGLRDGVDTSVVAAGTYDFELLWTSASSGLLASHATGRFTIVAGVAPHWVEPQNLPPIGGVWLANGPAGRLDLVWQAALATTARIRPVGGSWSDLAIDNWGQVIDEMGEPSGQQGAVLGYPSPGTYEILIQTGSPATRQATATLSIYPPSPGYWSTYWQVTWSYVPVGTDEGGYPIYGLVPTMTPVTYWVNGATPSPTLTVTTPPYVPGYMASGSPAQYAALVDAAPASVAISGSDGSTMAQSTASAEAAHDLRPLIQQTSDRWGNVLETTDPRSTSWKTTYSYNASDQLVRETHAGGSAGTATTDYFYDKLGRQVASRDARGNVNGQQFDAGGNLVGELHADGGNVAHAYDAFGNRVRTTDGEGHVVSFTYDRLGRQLSRIQGPIYVYGATAQNSLTDKVLKTLADSWTYDELGQKLTQKDGNGQALRYSYDLRGNLIQTRQPMGQSVRAAYDAQGHKVAELDANGVQATWDYDYFGGLRSRVDLGGIAYGYTYDHARQLTRQTSGRGQSLVFGYDAAGQQTTITDGALGKVTTYAYDLGGRKIRETVVQAGVTYQDNHLSYDGLGNLRDVADARVHLGITYDLAGNRTRVTTSVNYQGVAGEVTAPGDRWFAYDAMNRQIAVDAVDASGTRGRQGHTITYDRAGNRTSDTWWGNRVVVGSGLQYISTYDENMNAVYAFAPTATYTATEGETTEAYAYDAANRLTTVKRDGVVVDLRLYDGAGRVVQSGPGTLPAGHAAALNQGIATSQAIGTETRINRYNANGQLMHQKILSSDGQEKSDISWDPDESFTVLGTTTHADGYDAAGNAVGYVVRTPAGTPMLATYRNTLRRFDGYVTDGTSAGGPGVISGTVTQNYDVNGFLVGVTDPTRADGNRAFVNDAAGHALFVNQGGRIQRQLVVGGEVLGIYGVGADPVPGNSNFANIVDFDFGYSKITGNYPSASPGSYQVRPGETLQSIAQTAYGDSKLWYRIADANGIASNAGLKVGQTLNIPTSAGMASNDRGTFKPYDPSRVVGDTAPLLMPVPGAHEGCGGVGRLLMVAVAVAVFAYAPQIFGAIGSKGFFAGAMAGIASEAVGEITGTTSGFNWTNVALSSISGGVAPKVPILQDLPSAVQLPMRAAMASVVTQGIGIVTGLQSKFSWQNVAAASVSTAVQQQAGDALGLLPDGSRGAMDVGEYLLKSTIKSFASGLAAAAVKGGRIIVEQVAIDALGSAIGNSLAPPPGQPQIGFKAYGKEGAALRGVARDHALDELHSTIELDKVDKTVAQKILEIAATPAGPTSIDVAQSGGHYYLVGLIGRAVGIPNSRLSRIMFYSQYPDQVSSLDAFTNGVRYRLGGSDYAPAVTGFESMKALHALNGKTLAENVDIYTNIIRQNRENDAVIGIALHGLVDSIFHSRLVRLDDGTYIARSYAAPEGHMIHFSEPDYVSENQVKVATGAVINALQIVGDTRLTDRQLRGVMAHVDTVVREARALTERESAFDPSAVLDQGARMELNFRYVSEKLLGGVRGLHLMRPNDIVSPFVAPAITRDVTIEQTRAFMQSKGDSVTWVDAERVATIGMKAAATVMNAYRAITDMRIDRDVSPDQFMDTKEWSAIRIKSFFESILFPGRNKSVDTSSWGNKGQVWSSEHILPGYTPSAPAIPRGGVWGTIF